MSNAAVESIRDRVRRQWGDPVADAHVHPIRHRAEIDASETCGCFYCASTFSREEIKRRIGDEGTALCPRCGIDSVVGDASGYEVSKPFLSQMHSAWFQAQ
ncbi:MAG TPA: cytoplasmic protein [Hyphomicrobiaceae bacterium]|nr:cytoplasmic protein [Hyphomicrobiaceae bacterium]